MTSKNNISSLKLNYYYKAFLAIWTISNLSTFFIGIYIIDTQFQNYFTGSIFSLWIIGIIIILLSLRGLNKRIKENQKAVLQLENSEEK